MIPMTDDTVWTDELLAFEANECPACGRWVISSYGEHDDQRLCLTCGWHAVRYDGGPMEVRS